MSERPTNGLPARASAVRVGLGLALAPGAALFGLAVAPHVRCDPRVGDGLAFLGATAFPIVGLAVATTGEASLALTLCLSLPALATWLGVVWLQPAPSVALVLANAALVCLAWAFGSALGKRVQHPAHLSPACVVAASADLVSLLSPEGPSHAIAQSDRALSVLTVGFPVPGSLALAPALGIGDLLFMALVFGVAQRHGLPYTRTVGLCALGTALAGMAAAGFGLAMPALVPIAAVLLLGLPPIRRLRRADRAAAWVSMLAATSVAAVSLARALVLRH